jgi:hypothetical protein
LTSLWASNVTGDFISGKSSSLVRAGFTGQCSSGWRKNDGPCHHSVDDLCWLGFNPREMTSAGLASVGTCHWIRRILDFGHSMGYKRLHFIGLCFNPAQDDG